MIRTDFSDDDAWEAVCAASVATSPEGFEAHLLFISDPAFADLTVEQVMALPGAQHYNALYIVDHDTISGRETPILAVDMTREPGRSLRVVPAQMQSIENNLEIFNMDFSEFADAADPDGVFRGFADIG
ncbi:hypothetical protein BL253_25345 [Pseudofrankia asymbiotica]|uniref:DUF6924 domain-containing protein n=1 Tax=Pseudofrankia asymbiotica TaxID=1834516 RepID=A0A1V2I5N3_9ACTN|nr:hypothetical protein BL253_25345 [Pseudofrankia asymbiotica]